jgi:prophage DNA circulation protein
MALNDLHNKLYTASYNGVPFLFTDTERESGRKTAVHEYPGTSRRFVEDLGKFLPVFRITACLSNPGDDYFLKRDAFLTEIEKPGPGDLSHPFYGSFKVSIVNLPKVRESIRSLGVVEFDIEFAVTGEDVLPQIIGPTFTGIQAKVTATSSNLVTGLSNNFKPAVGSKSSYNWNVGMVQSALNSFNNSVLQMKRQIQTSTYFQSFNNLLRDSQKIALTISGTGNSLGKFINSIFNNYRELEVTPTIAFSGLKNLFGYRSEFINKAAPFKQIDPGAKRVIQANTNPQQSLPNPITIQKVNDIANHNLLSSTVNMLALVYAYEQAADIDYVTSDDVDTVQGALEDQYQYILTLPDIDYDLLQQIIDLRTDMRSFFNDIGKQVYQVIPVKTTNVPLAVLLYDYYADLSSQDEIQQLNGIVEPSFVEGDIKILVVK